jgi:hypothetical protein
MSFVTPMPDEAHGNDDEANAFEQVLRLLGLFLPCPGASHLLNVFVLSLRRFRSFTLTSLVLTYPTQRDVAKESGGAGVCRGQCVRVERQTDGTAA